MALMTNSGVPPKSWMPPNVTFETSYETRSGINLYTAAIIVQLIGHQTPNLQSGSVIDLIPIGGRMGNIVIELYWKHAPNTCRNFAELARRGYYNGVKFHRIIKDFMIQGGDPTGTGRGGASIYGKEFDDEIHHDLRHTGAGILSMANSGPNTNGSQFFITLAPTQWLDGKHAIFGRVSNGMTVVQRIGLVETDQNDRPVDDIKVLKSVIT